MIGECYVTQKMLIEEVLKQAPSGKRAMFRVISAPNSVSDEILGEHVYVKEDKVFSFMTRKGIPGIKASDLMFIDYV
jgi:uncharacterized protein (DUF3084 family)